MKTRTLTATAVAALMLAPLPSYAAPAGAPSAQKVAYEAVQYSDPFDYTIAWTAQEGQSLTLAASGMPEGITFTDNGDNTGKFSGHEAGPAGTYEITLTATDQGGATYDDTSTLTVLREDAIVRMLTSNPDSVSRRKSFVVKAKVKDTPDRDLGDITKADPGVFVVEDTRGHLATCPATIVPGSLETGSGPDFYEVRCRVAAGLHRGNYRVTYAVAGDYYAGRKSQQVQITR